jgi:GTP-binding protein Era
MPRTGHIALAGAPNVGKSSLLNALVGQHLAIVSPRAQATRLPVVGIRTDDDSQYIFHDLPGLLDPAYLMQVRMRELALEALAQMDVVPAPPPRLGGARTRAQDPHGIGPPVTAPVLTVYTKGDQVGADRREMLEREALVVSTTGESHGISRLLRDVRERLPEGDFAVRPRRCGDAAGAGSSWWSTFARRRSICSRTSCRTALPPKSKSFAKRNGPCTFG